MVHSMKLRRQHKKIDDDDFFDEFDDKPEELENFLSSFRPNVLKIKEMIIYELQKILRKEKKHKRTLKRSK